MSGLQKVDTRQLVDGALFLKSDGSVTPIANIPLGGFRLINVQDPINPQDVVTLHYLDSVVGTSGYSGYSGFSGYSGLGLSGYSGYSGDNGTSGYSGYSGISGYSGYYGVSGYSGYSGLGTSGYSGYSGINNLSTSTTTAFNGIITGNGAHVTDVALPSNPAEYLNGNGVFSTVNTISGLPVYTLTTVASNNGGNSWAEIGNVQFNIGGGSLWMVGITQGPEVSQGSGCANFYIVPTYYNFTNNVWYQVAELEGSGVATLDQPVNVLLDVNVNGTALYFRVRNPGATELQPALVTLWNIGNASDIFTPTNGTGSGAPPGSGFYQTFQPGNNLNLSNLYEINLNATIGSTGSYVVLAGFNLTSFAFNGTFLVQSIGQFSSKLHQFTFYNTGSGIVQGDWYRLIPINNNLVVNNSLNICDYAIDIMFDVFGQVQFRVTSLNFNTTTQVVNVTIWSTTAANLAVASSGTGATVSGLFTLGGSLTQKGSQVGINTLTPLVTLDNSAGGFSSNITPVTTTYTALSTDHTILANAGGGVFTVTLPTAATKGQILTIKKSDSSGNAVTVSRAGSDTIEGSTTKALASQYNSITLQADGTSEWWILSTT